MFAIVLFDFLLFSRIINKLSKVPKIGSEFFRQIDTSKIVLPENKYNCYKSTGPLIIIINKLIKLVLIFATRKKIVKNKFSNFGKLVAIKTQLDGKKITSYGDSSRETYIFG